VFAHNRKYAAGAYVKRPVTCISIIDVKTQGRVLARCRSPVVAYDICCSFCNCFMGVGTIYLPCRLKGGTEIAGLDIVGPVWQGWTMTDDLRTGVIWLVIDVVDQ